MKDHSHPLFKCFRNFTLFCLFILLIVLPRWLSAQTCLPSGITFSTQQQLDDFANNYPGCIEVLGDVTIKESVGGNIVSLSGLLQIQQINGELEIGGFPVGNTMLGAFDGLDNILTIGGKFRLLNNNNLSTLSGLESLTQIDGAVWLFGNDMLSTLSALNNLTTTGNSFRVEDCDALNNLSGLENLTSINGTLRISGNSNLSDISALQNIDPLTINNPISIGVDLWIDDNPSLNICEILSICEVLENPDVITEINSNASGCNSQAEIETACAALPLSWGGQPTVIEKNSNNEITWRVSQQINNEKFVIEFRSGNGDFQPVGEVKGHRTMLDEERYSFNHINPTSGLNYYRVKQVDLDGNFSYSDISSIYNARDNSISIYPNPTFTDMITVVVHEECIYSLHFSDGRIEVQGTLEIGENSIDLSSYKAGVYILKTKVGAYKIIKL